MKTLAAFLIALGSGILPAHTQEPSLDAPLPGQEESHQLEKPVSLIPESAPKMEKSPSSHPEIAPDEKLAQSKTLQSEAQLKQRIRLRQVKTLALKDLVVQQDWSRAAVATTDPEKRQALHDYYDHLFARILKIDHSLADLVKTRKDTALERLTQNHLDPPNVGNHEAVNPSPLDPTQ